MGLFNFKKKREHEIKEIISFQTRGSDVEIQPVKDFVFLEVKEIRKSMNLTQRLFAEYLGVSVRTVEAWEGRRNQPDGPTSRLLEILKNDPDFPFRTGVIKRKRP